MWWRIKMFNTKLIITNAMRQLRINVLVSVCPVWGVPSLSTLFPVLAMRCSGMTLSTRFSCAATTGFNLIPVILAAGTLSLLLFQGVRPVTCSISPRMSQESCALKAGSVSGFPMVLVWVGGAPLPVPPLPGFPLLLPPLPRSGCLGNVVAGNLRPLRGTLWYINEDCVVDQSFRVNDR